MVFCPWNGSSGPESKTTALPTESRNPLKLARYQSLLDSGQFENGAALARFLGVIRARVTQELRRLKQASNRSGSRPAVQFAV
jgi:hypothetical protein